MCAATSPLIWSRTGVPWLTILVGLALAGADGALPGDGVAALGRVGAVLTL